MKTWMTALLVAGGLIAAPLAGATAQIKPEKTSVTLGLPLVTSTLLPVYIAEQEGYFKQEGVDVKLVNFRGGTDLVRGMAAGAVDMGLTDLASVTVGIKAGQPLKVFYGGFNMTVFDWYAVPRIKSIKDSKGARYGVSTFGSSTDFLTRYALRKNGLDPMRDVRIIQGGGSAARLAAMQSGQLDVNIFAPPEKFMAAELGYNRILRLSDLAPDYPFHVFFSTADFIKSNPNTIKAVLRGVIRGIRTAKTNKALALAVLEKRVGIKKEYASRTYDDFINQIYEDGRLPSAAGMKAFWEIGIEGGVYQSPWPMDKYWVPTFRDSYNTWKPK